MACDLKLRPTYPYNVLLYGFPQASILAWASQALPTPSPQASLFPSPRAESRTRPEHPAAPRQSAPVPSPPSPGLLQQERAAGQPAVGPARPGPGLRGGAAPRPHRPPAWDSAGTSCLPALRGRKHSSAGTRAGAGHLAPDTAERVGRALLWDSRGARRAAPRTATARPHPAGRKTRDTAELGRALLLPFRRRDPHPWERRGRAPTWPRRAAVTRSQRVQTGFPPLFLAPHARQPAAFKSPGYSAGGESMRAGTARRGAGRGGTEVGGAARGDRGVGLVPRGRKREVSKLAL
nr:translation initiation factor IF-2-like [Macaca fascicularis]